MVTDVPRRAIARGIAWATPAAVVAAAAPAYAASTCLPQTVTLDWGTNYTSLTASTGSATVDPDGSGPISAVKMTVSSTFYGQTYDPGTDSQSSTNLANTTMNVGGTGDTGLALVQNQRATFDATRTSRQEVKFTFTDASGNPITVTNLTFLITDIDIPASTSNPGQFLDKVDISSTSTFTSSKPSGSSVSGAGTQANPFTGGVNADNTTGTGGNIRVSFASVSTFTLAYWNGQSPGTTSSRLQTVYLSNFTFTYVPKVC